MATPLPTLHQDASTVVLSLFMASLLRASQSSRKCQNRPIKMKHGSQFPSRAILRGDFCKAPSTHSARPFSSGSDTGTRRHGHVRGLLLHKRDCSGTPRLPIKRGPFPSRHIKTCFMLLNCRWDSYALRNHSPTGGCVTVPHVPR